MPKKDPKWRFALSANPVSEGWILCLEADGGVRGYGYASATAHMGATFDGLKAELDNFATALTGADPFASAKIRIDLDRRIRGAHQAKAAVDCALHDLTARALGLPLYQLLGGKVRESVPILRILPLKSADETAEAARALVDEGYSYLKIKVDGDIDEDVGRVAAVRKAVGPDVHLTIDANQSYTPKGAITALGRMAEYVIDLVEQPVAIDDLEGLALVTRTVPVTVEADESAASLTQIFNLVSKRIVDAVSLKIPKIGGLRATMAAAQICASGGVRYRLGAAVGSQLLSAHAMHLAAALPGIDYACELSEFDRLLDDPFTGLVIEGGRLTVPEVPGTGVELRPFDDSARLDPAVAGA
jgi:L-alanine-DL-glutamate epimerase-like enolase superfamily enzyme